MSAVIAQSGTTQGGCLCGNVRYRASGIPLHSIICHCHSCRKASGAPAVAWLTFERAQVVFLAGEVQPFQSSPGVIRRFCGNCGCGLAYESAAHPGLIDLTTVSLDDPALFPPTAEVWLEHRLAWQASNRGIEQYARGNVGQLQSQGVDMVNRICFVELPAAGIEASKAFYSAAFGFNMTEFGPTYACTLGGEVDLGIQADPAEATRAPLAVIQVESVEAAEALVRGADGTITKPIFSFPGGRRFHFRDPSGNELAAMQADRPRVE